MELLSNYEQIGSRLPQMEKRLAATMGKRLLESHLQKGQSLQKQESILNQKFHRLERCILQRVLLSLSLKW